MVVFHHARLSVPGSEFLTSAGEAGVDIFFVISGFVMAYTTDSLPRGAPLPANALAARDFFLNRVLRVVPLYFVALAWAAHRGYGVKFTGTDLIKDVLFLPHLNTEFPFWLSPVVRQGWTLDYEMFFYALFALSLLFGGMRRQVLIGSISALVAVGVWSTLQTGAPTVDDTLGWSASQHGLCLVMSRFFTNNIMLEFCFGVILEAMCRRGVHPNWPRWRFWLLLGIGFAGLILLHGLWPRSVMQGLPAALIVWSSIPACSGLYPRAMLLLGNASYSIYLFHWTSFGLLKPLMSRVGQAPGSPVRCWDCCSPIWRWRQRQASRSTLRSRSP